MLYQLSYRGEAAGILLSLLVSFKRTGLFAIESRFVPRGNVTTSVILFGYVLCVDADG